MGRKRDEETGRLRKACLLVARFDDPHQLGSLFEGGTVFPGDDPGEAGGACPSGAHVPEHVLPGVGTRIGAQCQGRLQVPPTRGQHSETLLLEEWTDGYSARGS